VKSRQVVQNGPITDLERFSPCQARGHRGDDILEPLADQITPLVLLVQMRMDKPRKPTELVG
jgi:hypothetical protein